MAINDVLIQYPAKVQPPYIPQETAQMGWMNQRPEQIMRKKVLVNEGRYTRQPTSEQFLGDPYLSWFNQRPDQTYKRKPLVNTGYYTKGVENEFQLGDPYLGWNNQKPVSVAGKKPLVHSYYTRGTPPEQDLYWLQQRPDQTYGKKQVRLGLYTSGILDSLITAGFDPTTQPWQTTNDNPVRRKVSPLQYYVRGIPDVQLIGELGWRVNYPSRIDKRRPVTYQLQSLVPVECITNGRSLDVKDATGASSITTASVTPTANYLVLCAVSNRKPGASIPTVSGCSLTWVQIGTIGWSSSSHTLTLFRALSATPTAGTITADFGGVSQEKISISVTEFSNVDTSGTNGSGAIVQVVTNATDPVTASTDFTVTLGAFTDSHNATYSAITASSDISIGTGFIKLNTVFNNTVSLLAEWQDANDTTATAQPTADTAMAGIAVEIKSACAAVAIFDPSTQSWQMYNINPMLPRRRVPHGYYARGVPTDQFLGDPYISWYRQPVERPAVTRRPNVNVGYSTRGIPQDLLVGFLDWDNQRPVIVRGRKPNIAVGYYVRGIHVFIFADEATFGQSLRLYRPDDRLIKQQPRVFAPDSQLNRGSGGVMRPSPRLRGF